MSVLMIIAKAVTRILAFLGKELVEVARRPGALMSLILGPFLIMAVFGIGYSGFKRPLNTVVVVPSETGLPTDPAYYENVAGAGIKVIEVTEDTSKLDQQLSDGTIDLAVIAPPDTQQKLESGQQSVIEVRVDASDPLDGNYATLMADQVSNHVNRELIRRAAEQGQAQLGPQAGQIPPEIIASPTRAEVNNIAPVQPTVVEYFGPAVLALILQHMAVSLIALSVIRERTTGMIELFRISPVSAWEIVSGKIIGFGALAGAIAAITIALMVLGLNVPNIGSGLALGGVVALLVLASLGLGMLIAAGVGLGASDRAAVAAGPPGVDLLLGVRAAADRVLAAGPGARATHPGDERHRADAGRDVPGRRPGAVAGGGPRGHGRRAAGRLLAAAPARDEPRIASAPRRCALRSAAGSGRGRHPGATRSAPRRGPLHPCGHLASKHARTERSRGRVERARHGPPGHGRGTSDGWTGGERTRHVLGVGGLRGGLCGVCRLGGLGPGLHRERSVPAG